MEQNRGPLIIAVVAGIIGSLGSVWALGKGTYDIAPLKVKLAVAPAASGSTTLGIEAGAITKVGEAKAGTHSSPLAFDATIIGVDVAGLAKTSVCLTEIASECKPLSLDSPQAVAQYLAANGTSEVRTFGIKVGAIALAGGFVLSLVVSLGKWKRAIAGAVAGTVLFGILGLLAKQTYDTKKFEGTQFSQTATSQK